MKVIRQVWTVFIPLRVSGLVLFNGTYEQICQDSQKLSRQFLCNVVADCQELVLCYVFVRALHWDVTVVFSSGLFTEMLLLCFRQGSSLRCYCYVFVRALHWDVTVVFSSGLFTEMLLLCFRQGSSLRCYCCVFVTARHWDVTVMFSSGLFTEMLRNLEKLSKMNENDIKTYE